MNRVLENNIPVVIINGSVGVGKSRVADEISEILGNKNISHAVIDMDYLRHAYPRSENDPFNEELGYKNLASVWKNYKDLGTKHLILVSVVEDKKSLNKYRDAIPGADISVVRLWAKIETLEKNLKNRETGKNLQGHLSRAKDLVEKLGRAKVEDFVIDTENKSVEEIAKEVLSKSHFME